MFHEIIKGGWGAWGVSREGGGEEGREGGLKGNVMKETYLGREKES